jgi:hypothetical protein
LFGANFVWGRFDLLPIKSCDTSPGISDHYAIVIDSNLKPSYNKPKRRNINLFKKANWKNIKEEIAKIGSTIINSTKSLEEKWTDLTDGINNALNTNVPSKQTSRRHNLPWLTPKDKLLIKKKNRLFQQAKQTKKEEDWTKYRKHKRVSQKAVRQSHWKYVNDILDTDLEKRNNKHFWKYVKSKRTDNVHVGVSGIKKNGILHQDSKTKANLLNDQFKSVFTREDTSEPLPNIGDLKYSTVRSGTYRDGHKMNPSVGISPTFSHCDRP